MKATCTFVYSEESGVSIFRDGLPYPIYFWWTSGRGGMICSGCMGITLPSSLAVDETVHQCAAALDSSGYGLIFTVDEFRDLPEEVLKAAQKAVTPARGKYSLDWLIAGL